MYYCSDEWSEIRSFYSEPDWLSEARHIKWRVSHQLKKPSNARKTAIQKEMEYLQSKWIPDGASDNPIALKYKL